MGAFGLEFQLDNDPKYSSSTSLHPNIAVNASYSYGNSLYRATGLAAGIHHLNINSSQPRSFSYIFFDYAIITYVMLAIPTSNSIDETTSVYLPGLYHLWSPRQAPLRE